MTGEFDIIARYFAPLAGPEGLGLVDDASLFVPEAGYDLVVTKDILLEAVHFLPTDPPETIAIKALAVNLSDLAAKGARPRLYWLGLALPRDRDEAWVKAFSAGLASAQARWGISLAGGDTTASPQGVVISITALGDVPKGQMIRRSGAIAGDDVYVSGTLGDAALGLECLRGHVPDDGFLAGRYRLPEPRLALGGRLRGLANAAADISDGLIADLGHICDASGLGAEVEAGLLPKSDAALRVLAARPDLQPLVWSGGDDYELVFTCPPGKRADIAALSKDLALPIARIGHMTTGQGVRLLDQGGQVMQITRQGYQHF